MSREKLVIRDNVTLRTQYNSLQEGDVVLGRLRLRQSEEHLLVDLAARGIHLIPSGLSQLAGRSKTFQAAVFSRFMLPHTLCIHTQHDLIEAVPEFQKNGIGAVVTKQELENAGMGVHLWQSIEEVFSHTSLGNLPLPFVLQPFEPKARDIRVIILGDYIEAYWRHNPYNFRNNLHLGGRSEPCSLNSEQAKLCRQVMARGQFPYGHLDILINEEGKSFLGEINLRGGIQGAKITPAEYRERVEAIHERLLDSLTV